MSTSEIFLSLIALVSENSTSLSLEFSSSDTSEEQNIHSTFAYLKYSTICYLPLKQDFLHSPMQTQAVLKETFSSQNHV